MNTNENEVKVFKKYFQGRSDVFAVQKEDGGYGKVEAPMTDCHIAEHLGGGATYGVYNIIPIENTCYHTIIDLDTKEPTVALSIYNAILLIGMSSEQVLVEFSGNKGYHFWLGFEKALPASKAKRLGQAILELSVHNDKVEVFPKQATVEKNGYGNLVKLPMGIHRKSGKRSYFVDSDLNPISDWVGHLQNVKKISEDRLDEILAQHVTNEPAQRFTSVNTAGDVSKKGLPCFRQIMEAGVPEGERNHIAFRLVVYMKNSGMPEALIQAAITNWNRDKVRPSLSDSEVNNVITSAMKPEYTGYGCDDPLLKKYCSAECPIRKKETIFIPTGQCKVNIEEQGELTGNDIAKILGLTIKKDETNKVITFLCELSAFTDDSQFNISFNAPSSTGKSYIPTEIARLFPAENVKEFGYASPKSFFHDTDEYDEETHRHIINFSKKILIFLDQPDPQLLGHLRPLLSHDKKEIVLKISDKNKSSGNRTKTILLRGFPSVVFCTAWLTVDEQEATRFLLLSPESSQEKIRQGINEKIKKETDKAEYQRGIESNGDRLMLKDRIVAIKEANIKDIRIGNPDRISKLFYANKSKLKPKHQRDINRVFCIVKAFALLNYPWRNRDESGYITANENDITEAFKLWDVLSESQEYDIPPYLFDLYRDILVPIWKEKNCPPIGGDRTDNSITLIDDTYEYKGIAKKEILARHIKVYARSLSDWQYRREIIPGLEACGLIRTDNDPEDKRRQLIYLTNMNAMPTPPEPSSVKEHCPEITAIPEASEASGVGLSTQAVTGQAKEVATGQLSSSYENNGSIVNDGLFGSDKLTTADISQTDKMTARPDDGW